MDNGLKPIDRKEFKSGLFYINKISHERLVPLLTYEYNITIHDENL